MYDKEIVKLLCSKWEIVLSMTDQEFGYFGFKAGLFIKNVD